MRENYEYSGKQDSTKGMKKKEKEKIYKENKV